MTSKFNLPISVSVRSVGKVTLALAAFVLLSAQNCGELLDDPGFDLWCGDQLCSWEVEEGAIAQTPTWHARDHGVEFLGDKAAISQFVDQTSANVSCIRFEMIADVEETVAMTLQLDFYDDGTIDFEQVIPTSSWAELSYVIPAPVTFQGIRFRLRKNGAGRAVLAEISAAQTDSCLGQPRPIVSDRREGARCSGGGQCGSGLCTAPAYDRERAELGAGVCGLCEDDSACAAGEACGFESDVPAFLDAYLTCGPAGRHALGERCASDAACATGVCCEGVCSTCCGEGSCGAGACERRDPEEELPAFWPTRPYQCAPEGGLATTDEPCLTGADCASGACTGGEPLTVCLYDGRTCSSDADCPHDGVEFFTGDPLRESGYCAAVGTRGGVCE